MNTAIRLTLHLVLLLMCKPVFSECPDLQPSVAERVGWMSGSWGVRIVMPGGRSNFSPYKITREIASLKSASYVMINLNAGSLGGKFTAPAPNKKYDVSENMFSDRDIFYQAAKLLKSENKRVLAYVAAQGPYSENVLHWPKPRTENEKKGRDFVNSVRAKWVESAKSTGRSPNQLWAELLSEYSTQYGDLIDGWWFDYGQWGDKTSLTKAVRSGNPEAAVSWNDNHGNSTDLVRTVNKKRFMPKWILARSHIDEDYTGGHPTPPEVHPPWWEGNYTLVEQAIESCSINGALAHIIMPMQENWRAGFAGFNTETAYKWTIDTIKHGGAFTWAVALRSPEFKYSQISDMQLQQLKYIDAQISIILNK